MNSASVSRAVHGSMPVWTPSAATHAVIFSVSVARRRRALACRALLADLPLCVSSVAMVSRTDCVCRLMEDGPVSEEGR